MLTKTEARMKAALLAMTAVQHVGRHVSNAFPEAEDWGPVYRELELIERWLRGRAVGGDKIAARQMRRK